ncbi:tubulin monoglutamylase TTLL4 [Calliopsis andreniformis]|uniref:tubulin monoglutamylase TTLL4 n=1 Tax=Calliopsis andreniformis TaxID=337506 RepID=UPI003FCE05AC
MLGDLGHPDPSKPENTPNRCAATSTSRGMINLDRDEDWVTYERITEAAILRKFRGELPGRLLAPSRPIAKSADVLRGKIPTSKNRSTGLGNGFQRNEWAEDTFNARGDGDKAEDVASLWMRKSLFPHVPPYVLFHSYDEKRAEQLPKDFAKLLKWKVTTYMPKILVRILVNSGYQLVIKGNDWSGVWFPCSSDNSRFQRLQGFQKVNSIPGSQNLGNKDLLWTNLSRMMRKFGSHEYNFMPKTFVLPQDTRKLEGIWLKYSGGHTWIIKPPCSGRGQGIRIIDQWWEIPKWHSMVVQRYISRPRLINSTKFDLRVYVLVTGINPLRIYIYKEGLVRFASVRYLRGMNLNDKFMHLTNTSVNKQNPEYVMNDGINSFKGHKWSFGSLWSYLKEEGVDEAKLWSRIKDIVVKTLIATESSMHSAVSKNLTSNYTCYELYGFDVLLDESFKPWLLEVNALPSLQTDSPLDRAIKGPLVRDVLNMAGYQVPRCDQLSDVRKRRYNSIAHDDRLYSKILTVREKVKQEEINALKTRKEYLDRILDKLTRDDLRQLVRYEDELTQIGNFEKIFPTNQSHSYLRYFEVERYYDRLLHAWEYRYSNKRNEGINMLKKFCERMLHIQQSYSD